MTVVFFWKFSRNFNFRSRNNPYTILPVNANMMGMKSNTTFVGGVIGMVRSGAKGDWLGFGLSAASLVLDVAGLFSFGAENGASLAVKGGKLARVAVKGAKALNKGKKIAKVLKKVPKVVLKAAPKLLTKAGAKSLALKLAAKVDDIALKTGKICVFAGFPTGTLINTEHGQTPIERIKTGDKVWAFDEDSGVIELKEVLQIVNRECDHTIELYTTQETIETTAEHPFYTTNGWKDAADLEVGDKIITQNDETIEITGKQFNYEPKRVYNFEVADWHTYFVGALAWLVHNTKPEKCLSKLLDFLKTHKTKKFIVGGQEAILDNKGLKHILERQHSDFWDDSTKTTQRFLPKNYTVKDIENGISEVMKQNRDAMMKME